MYFDALTTAAVADELQSALQGGRVQQILLPDKWSVGLEIYAQGRRRYLLATAHSQHARVHLTDHKLRRGPDLTPPLLTLLRKYVRGGRVLRAWQPPLERILRLEVGHPAGNTTLVVEVMGRHANIILVNEAGQIMDAVKRVGPQVSRRVVLPGQAYTPPPPRRGLDPTDLTELRLRRLLAEDAATNAKMTTWRALVRGVQGVSPLLAREIVFRATGDAQTLACKVSRISPLLDALHDLLLHLRVRRWDPCLAYDDHQIVAFAPYPLQQYADCRSAAGISAAVTTYFESLLGADAYAAARRQTVEAIQEARKRVERKRDALVRSMTAVNRADELRLKGEMTLAYAHAVEPGQTELLAPVEPDGAPLQIVLDPHLTAVENAQRYFHKYEKAKRAAQQVPAHLAQADGELRYLDQLATDLSLAASRPEIAEVEAALVQAGYLRAGGRTPGRVPRSGPLIVNSADGFRVLVGRNSQQNEKVTFKQAAPDDLWLHARGIPGGHVVIKSRGQEVPERTVRQAAALAAYYSRDRHEAVVAVDVVVRRRVRRAKGKRPGLVTYRGERTMRVKPEGE